jgi:hypothetical protein
MDNYFLHKDAAQTPDIDDVTHSADGVDLRDLRPATELWVWTTHSLYRFLIGQALDVSVEGGEFFPQPAAVELIVARLGPQRLRAWWIGPGLSMEIVVGDRHVVTSPVLGIVSERRGRANV